MAGWIKLGLYSYKNWTSSILYMIPEILILTFLMLNDVYLRMIGLFFQTEIEIENILDGLQRNIECGDIEKVEQEKDARLNMNMEERFVSFQEQKDEQIE